MLLKDTQGEFYRKQRGTVLIVSTQIRWFSEQSDGRLDLKSDSLKRYNLLFFGVRRRKEMKLLMMMMQ